MSLALQSRTLHYFLFSIPPEAAPNQAVWQILSWITIMVSISNPSSYVDPLLRRQKIEEMSPEEFISIPITDLNQSGPLVAGPGAKRDVAASILGVALPKLERRDQDYIAKGKKYAMEQSIKYVLMKQTLAHQQQQAKSLQRHQALVLMCRVYIGSISFELREDTIRQAFAPFGPIKTINMSWDPVAQKHKGFAFVEYDLPEAAQLALEQMNGVMIGGRNIKCGRDTRIKFSHMDQVIDDLMEEAKAYHRIYVASIHPDLTEEDIKSVFEAFGKIKACKLAPGPSPGKHRGYGFIEYDTAEAAAESITSMNLFDLGGQYLRVGKAITPPNALQANPGQSQMPQAAAVAAAAATAKIQAMEAVTNTAAAFGLTKEETLTSSVMAGMSPTISVMPVGVPGIPTAVPGVISQPQLVTPKLGSLSLSNAPTVSPVNLPPPGIAMIPAVGTITPIPSVTPSVASVSGFGQPAPAPVAAPVGIPPVSSLPQATSMSQIAPVMVASPYQMPGITSSAVGVPPPIDKPSLPGQESNSTREELVKRLVEENENLSISAQENVSIRGQSARHEVMQRLMRPESSPVIVLKNMVEPEDVDDSLQEEIMEECSKFGTVERVLIYQETQSEEDNAPIVVKIFVEFSNASEAEAAKNSLNGRFFGGKVVICEIYEFSMYINHDLSG
ncbi:unnamed protein product [Allacma fusca]|uniref:RRM domain-containing protein n=1 Tax=Allacma fusca TaxID=39272 RepID=A0A8J2J259_9HEXA|nr:unnamed protein product [Allacma fusca]